MDPPESLALELLAYKVADYLRGQDPSGGVRSMWQLMEDLKSRPVELDRSDRDRLEELAERLDEHERVRIKSGTDTLESLILGTEENEGLEGFDTDFGDALVLEALEDTSVPEASRPPVNRHETEAVRAERMILQRIAERAWWDDVEDFVHRTAASWRAQRDRITSRLVYATMQNLEVHSKAPGFEQDVNLRRFKVTVPVPEREDPLVSFSDLESLAEIVRNLIEAVLSVRDERGLLSQLEIQPADALEYVKTTAMKVSQNPYAGKLSVISPRGFSSDQLRLAIRELSKERMSDQQKTIQRKHYEQRLAETLAYERSLRQMFQRDIHRFGDVMHAFFERLADHLPPSVGGKGAGPQLPSAVLFGEHPALRVERVPSGAEAITARLIGPLRFTIGGIDIAVTGTGSSRGLFVAEEEHSLSEHMTLHVDGARLSIYQLDEYLHVRVRAGDRSLASLMGEALVVFFVLSQEDSENMLATLGLLSNAVQGDPTNLISQAIDRIGAITASTPSRRSAIEGLVKGAAGAVGATVDENALMGLVHRLHVAITAQPGDIAAILQQFEGTEKGVHHLGSSPITIDVAGMKLTLREYSGRRAHESNVVLMLPGHVLGSFSQYLLEPLDTGTLVCARAEHQVAVAFVRDVSIAIPRAV